MSFVSVCCYGHLRISAQLGCRPFQRGRFRIVAGVDRRAARGHDGPAEHGCAGAAERADSLADLYCCAGISF